MSVDLEAENTDFLGILCIFSIKKSNNASKLLISSKDPVLVKKTTKSDINFAFLLKNLVFSSVKDG